MYLIKCCNLVMEVDYNVNLKINYKQIIFLKWFILFFSA